MKIEVDRNKCTGIGVCETLAPDLFEVDDNGWLQLISGDEIPAEAMADVDAAIAGCPTAALRKHH